MTHTARRISAEDLSARLNIDSDDELGRLASTFDGMLARLEDAFRRECQFTADASHELRTPLAAMQAILNVTRQRRRESHEYEQALDDLAAETDHLRELTKSLLALARADLNPPQSQDPIDLSTLLEDVSESMRPLAGSQGLELISDIPADLTIKGNQDSLIRLFVNLLDNAIKYTTEGHVTLKARRERSRILVTIQDTGMGISPEHLPHIFERFYRAEQSRTQSGTGLGLSLAQRIAQVHGGNISAESQPGQGTTFTVNLPPLADP